ncbi:hypothetical protein ACOSQ2_007494 [Xanthoceras sorbifolium]
MLVTYGKNGRNRPNGYSGSRGYAGYPADKGRNSGTFQSVKAGVGSIAAPSGTGGYGGSVDKVQGAAKDGIKAVFDNYRKESSVSKKGVAVNSGVAQGSHFDVLLNDLREGNLVLFDKKSKGKKHISSAEGGPNIGGKKVLADISNKVENSVKVSDLIFSKTASKYLKKGPKAPKIVKGAATKKKPSKAVQKDPDNISLAQESEMERKIEDSEVLQLLHQGAADSIIFEQ